MSQVEAASRSLTLAVLDVYFDDVFPLRDYLIQILVTQPPDASAGEGTDNSLLREGDSQEYSELLTTSVVGLRSTGTESHPRFMQIPPLMYMRDIIQKAHERLFLHSRARPNNIIASGYQRASDNATANSTTSGVTNRFVNTIITALQAPEWETLLQRIGADAMLHLLLKTSIFVSLPNECLCQLTGEPLIYIPLANGTNLMAKQTTRPHAKRKLESSVTLPRKRQKLILVSSNGATKSVKASARQNVNQPIERRTPADISFVRTRIFYARPSRDPDAYRIVVGLPYDHILNRINPAYFKRSPRDPATYKDPDPEEQARNVRHLSKYVFPLQYGLPNVFGHVANRSETYRQPLFADREYDIRLLGRCKTPKRLKDVLLLLDKMIWRHGKCAYKPLRDKVCPSKIKGTDNKDIESSVILEMVSENSIYIKPHSQMSQHNISLDSEGNSILPQGLAQAQNHAQGKPRFVEFACSDIEVFRYVLLITKIVIPKQFWGSKRNFNIVQRYLKEFICLRRHETFTLHYILRGFSTADCDWVMPPGTGMTKQVRVSVTDALKRRELLEEFMFWYFDSFVIPLVKTTFYVTDSSAFRNQVLYFRQDDWEVLCAPLIDQLSEKTFQQIERREAEEILRQRRLGFSFVRLLPKETGVRPIVNLRRRSRPKGAIYSGPEQSINQVLQATFQILTYERRRQPDLLGASVFGPNEIYARLKAFKTRLLDRYPSGQFPKLYFVKVDVQACFDTIEQSTLLNILKDLMSEDNYIIQKYGQIAPVAGKIRRVYTKKAYPDDEHPDFVAYARDLASTLRQSIFVDQVNYSFESRRNAMQLLEEHVNENIVKIGQRYYRQVVGIPQGSVLSAILCCYFYGDLERGKLSNFSSNDPESILLRLIDDYFFVTTTLQKAKSFLDVMVKGHPEYGCMISKEKTVTNFDYGAEIMNITSAAQTHFAWCGLLINMTDLSVMADYGRYSGTDLRHSLTVEKGRRQGAAFVHKMLQLAKSRSHIIFTDAVLNDTHTVYRNIYQNLLITAAKMDYYIESWGIDVAKNAAFINNTIRQVIRYSHASILRKSRNEVAKANGARCNVQRVLVNWLGTRAFYAVFSKRSQRYGACSLLQHLKSELSLQRNRGIQGRFRKLVKESAEVLAALGL